MILSSTKMHEVKQLLQKLRHKDKDKADMIWARYQVSNRDDKQRLEEYIRALAVKEGIETVQDQVVLPPPSISKSLGDIPLGNVMYPGIEPYPFNISLPELTRHTGIFGYTGTGKTTLARNVIADLIRKKVPVLIIDWETSYRSLLNEFPEFKMFTIGRDVSPFRFNFFKVPPGVDYKDYVKDVVGVFSRSYIGGAGVDNILRKIFDKAYQFNQMPTLEEVKAILSQETAPKNMRGRAMNWKQTAERMIEFLCYGRTEVAFNTKSPEGIDPLLNGPVILELGGLGNDGDKQFTVQIILLWYWRLLESKGTEDEKLKRIILLEEFHRLSDNPLIIDAFRMMRKYGSGIIALDQMPAKVPDEVFENMGTKVTFALQKDQNIRAIASSMYMTSDQVRYIGLLQKGQAIMRCAERYPYPFMLTVPFKGIPVHVTDETIRKHMKPYSNLSASDVPFEEKRPPLRSSPYPEYVPSGEALILLQAIAREPFLGTDKRYKSLGLSPRQGTELKTRLVEGGYLNEVRVDRKVLYELTQTARELLAVRKIPMPRQARGGIEHNYWLEEIKETLKKKEHFPFKEKDDIDLVVESYNCTWLVQVETGKSNIKKNIETLLKSRADRFIMIATNKAAELKIRNILATVSVPGTERIEVFFIKDFLTDIQS